MSAIPSILVTDGWGTDQNNKLTEIVIPSTVKTLQAPNKVTFMGTVLNAVPSTTAALQEIDCPNLTGIATVNFFTGYNSLITASLNSVTSLVNIPSSSNNGTFRVCTALNTINMTSLLSIGSIASSGTTSGHFYGCTALTTINMPLLQTIGTNSYSGSSTAGHFYGCTSLTTVTLPHIQTIGGGGAAYKGNFSNCTGLTSVQLGSEGHPVTSIGNYTFGNCTQSGLTITIYTTGGASLSGEPWGATNATIVYETA